MKHWWEEAVFYQIYPRSFADSNGDGVGDLAGIRSRLDYLSQLGIGALWISPFFKSPMKDFGYDVADYCDVDPLFGSLVDLKSLIGDAKARGIRIVLDFVANHSSDEHPWFAEARTARDNPRHDWYLWVPDSGKPPNNWKAVFELGSAWHPNPATGERYLGTFTRHQPEFDWRNPQLRQAMYGVMKFWYDFGVDGFRLDVATAYVKDEALRSNPFSFKAIPDFFQKHVYDRNRPEVHEIFREMRRVSDSAGERVLIGETHGLDPSLAASSHGEKGDELHMAFNFDFLYQPWGARNFRRSAERWYSLLSEGAWPNFTLSNHDQPRSYWRYRGRGPGPKRRLRVTEGRARVAAAMLLTLRGTPFIYYGEEIGMSCERLPKKALRDPLGISTWPLGFLGRDPERTPMQWEASEGGGFTSGQPWLPLNSDHAGKNVAFEESDPESLLAWYKTLIGLRKSRGELLEGGISFLDLGPDLLAYERHLSDSGGCLVLLNFASAARRCTLPWKGRLLLGSHRETGSQLAADRLTLEASEVLIVEKLKSQV